MNRRSFLLAGVAGLAGCAGVGVDADGRGGRTVAPALEGTPTASPPPPPEPTAAADAAGRLARARSVVVSNRQVRPEWVYLGVLADGESVLETTFRVPAAGRTSVAGVLGRARPYAVAIRTADGRTRTTEWTPPAAGANLAVDLDGGIGVRDGYSAEAARGFVETSSGGLLADPSVGGVPLVLDNPGPARAVRISVSVGGGDGSSGGGSDGGGSDGGGNDGNGGGGGDGSATADVRVPAGARLPVPLSVPRGQAVVAVRTADGADRHGWRPTTDGGLYCRTDPAPRLSCDLLVRDLVVVDGGSADREVRVRVRADGALAVDRTVYPTAGGRVRLRTAVPPAGSYVLTASDAAGRSRGRTVGCPARGPFVVRVDDGGIAIGSEPVAGTDGAGTDGTGTDGTGTDGPTGTAAATTGADPATETGSRTTATASATAGDAE